MKSGTTTAVNKLDSIVNQSICDAAALLGNLAEIQQTLIDYRDNPAAKAEALKGILESFYHSIDDATAAINPHRFDYVLREAIKELSPETDVTYSVLRNAQTDLYYAHAGLLTLSTNDPYASKTDGAVSVSVILDSYTPLNGLPVAVRAELEAIVKHWNLTYQDLDALDGVDTPAAIKFKQDFINSL